MPAPAKRRKKPKESSLWLADYPLYYMSHVVAQSQRKIQEAIAPLNIAPNQWRVLFLLHDQGELSISEISEESLIEVSTLSRLLNSLEKRKLIGRMRDADDQRYTRIRLTDQGQDVYEKVLPVVANQLEFTLQGFSSADRKTLLRLLKKMKENVYRSPFAVT